MHVSFRGNDKWGDAPHHPPGLHLYAWMVDINTEADGGYLALESVASWSFSRLHRDGLEIRRDPVTGGQMVYDDNDPTRLDAIWWFNDALEGGLYQAIVADEVGRRAAYYVAIDITGRLCFVSNDPVEAVEDLLGDYPADAAEDALFPETGYPDEATIARMAAAIPEDQLP